MTAVQTVKNQRKEIGNRTNTPPIDTVRASQRSTHRFQEITRQIISNSSAARSAHAPRCHVTPILHSGEDRCKAVAPTHRWPTHDGNSRFHSTSSTNCSGANRRSSRQALDHKFLQAANISSTHQKGNKPSHVIANTLNDKSAPQMPVRTSSEMSLVRVADPDDKRMASQNTKGRLQTRDLAGKLAAPDDKRMAGQNTKGRSQTRDLAGKHKSLNEFCKDCRTSIMESVCFIGNDGKITAARTGAMHARSLHYCSKPGCAAAYRGSHPPKTAGSRKFLSKKQALLTNAQPQPTNIQLQSHAEIEDRLSVCSSTSTSSIVKGSHNVRTSEGLSESNEACRTARNLEKDSEHWLTTNMDSDMDSYSGVPQHQVGVQSCPLEEALYGFSHNEDKPCSPASRQNQENQQCSEENHGHDIETMTPGAASCISSDIHDRGGDDDEMGSAHRNAGNELHQFKSLCYHGDNEYSCSEDGTDATITPNSLMTGAFYSPSTADADQEHSENKASKQRRSSVALMRQRYLDSLAEQEAERVRLRKQEIMARKQAGDWMLDCHMEELVHKLAPNGEARVKVLVEAFEQVMHYSDSEGSQANHQSEHNQTHDEQDQLNESMHTDSSS